MHTTLNMHCALVHRASQTNQASTTCRRAQDLFELLLQIRSNSSHSSNCLSTSPTQSLEKPSQHHPPLTSLISSLVHGDFNIQSAYALGVLFLLGPGDTLQNLDILPPQHPQWRLSACNLLVVSLGKLFHKSFQSLSSVARPS